MQPIVALGWADGCRGREGADKREAGHGPVIWGKMLQKSTNNVDRSRSASVLLTSEIHQPSPTPFIEDGAHMPVGKLWAGKVYGTNTGNLFVKLEGEDKALKGTLHHNDPDTGIAVYDIAAFFDGTTLSLEGRPSKQMNGMPNLVKGTARLQPTGNLEGQWETDIGSAGTFVLFPHDRGEASVSGVPVPDQMHWQGTTSVPSRLTEIRLSRSETKSSEASRRGG